MHRIGVLTAFHSQAYIEKAVSEIENIEFIFLPYERPSQISELYQKYEYKVDGFLLSGIYTQSVLSQELQHVSVPSVYLDVSEGDFYQELFNIARTNGLNVSRTIIDFLTIENNYMGLKQILTKDERPYTYSNEFTDYLHEDVYERLIEFHVSLWEKGLVDLSITRMSNVVDELKSRGIHTLFLFPSEASIQDSIRTLIHQIQELKLLNNQTVVGHLSGKQDQTNQIRIEYIKQFEQKYGYSFLIHNKYPELEIITTYGELKQMTSDFTSCSLSIFLSEQLQEQMHVGWGTGKSLLQARLHAETASRQEQGSYVLTESDLIGPMQGMPTTVNRDFPAGDQLMNMSEQSGLTILQLQKIQAALKRVGSDVISSEELAFYLGVTIRSANRILKKLEEANLAEVSLKRQERLRGRPKKIYKIKV
ncbi:hypothetical protein [Alkalicoccobacillus plakortidis]|uniref:HTH domain-containing protein n=1 Tax=Alkalicoccobacillus plakortidis TaxID=444060 RepID=A0ABT0XN79_9BACI|nr:hypothetical protein [Alkalicoccobacillus plakortidis]MCM2677185.1 hypothetical protein [Alkalicoccobacillus plakortidis]